MTGFPKVPPTPSVGSTTPKSGGSSTQPAAAAAPPTAKVTAAYGVRPNGTYGIRGYRAHCDCGYLGNTVSYNGARHQRRAHTCKQMRDTTGARS